MSTLMLGKYKWWIHEDLEATKNDRNKIIKIEFSESEDLFVEFSYHELNSNRPNIKKDSIIISEKKGFKFGRNNLVLRVVGMLNKSLVLYIVVLEVN